MLLLAEHANSFVSAEPPDWVAGWIASRTQRAEAKASKDVSAPVDEAAQAKRAEQRASRISEGLDVLELWLRDLVQSGLASSASRDFAFWDQQAARLVDAQAPGAARRVRNLAAIALSGDGWQDRMLAAIGRLVLLVHAYRRLDQLDPATQADVKTAIGVPVVQEEVLAAPPVRDRWLVAGQRIVQEDRLRVQRTWLIGLGSGSQALLLDFAHGTAGFKNNLIAGSVVDCDICFFPSASPLRALVKEVRAELHAPERPLPGASVAEAYASFGGRLAANPWMERQPALLRAVVPIPSDRQWHLGDVCGDAIPCAADDAMLALSGGRPIDVFVEWDGVQATSLLVADNRRIVGLGPGAAV